ncbi:MAG: 5-formyltetrahydrofolate cyclo-ligase [Armatimonadaceae bacterium]
MQNINQNDKQVLREWAIAKRKEVNLEAAAKRLLEQLTLLPEWQSARRVLLYLAMPDELNVEAILWENAGKAWFVPRCAPKRRLAVHRYVPGETPMHRGPFGIREPDPAQVAETDPTEMDLVIVPALLYAPNGWRLGHGGGYYDRFLPRLRPDCVRIGLVPDELIVETLPVDPWDQPVQVVQTPTRHFRAGEGIPGR